MLSWFCTYLLKIFEACLKHCKSGRKGIYSTKINLDSKSTLIRILGWAHRRQIIFIICWLWQQLRRVRTWEHPMNKILYHTEDKPSTWLLIVSIWHEAHNTLLLFCKVAESKNKHPQKVECKHIAFSLSPNHNAQPEFKGRQHRIGEIWDGTISEVYALGRFCCSYLFETWSHMVFYRLLELDTCIYF